MTQTNDATARLDTAILATLEELGYYRGGDLVRRRLAALLDEHPPSAECIRDRFGAGPVATMAVRALTARGAATGT